jgi:hypothetical protein
LTRTDLGREDKGRVIEGPMVHESPENTEQLIHQDADGLHFGQGVRGAVLEVEVVASKAIVEAAEA